MDGVEMGRKASVLRKRTKQSPGGGWRRKGKGAGVQGARGGKQKGCGKRGLAAALLVCFRMS